MLRYLNLECPQSSLLNQRFSVHVQFLIEPSTSSIQRQESRNIEILESTPTVEIVLRAQSFDIQGSNTKIIQLQQNDDIEERFILIPRQLDQQLLKVDLYQQEQKIITLTRSINIVSGEGTGDEIFSPSQVETTLELKNQFSVSPADLELTVELEPNDNRTLYFTLNSKNPYIDCHHRSIGQVTLRDSPKQKMQSVYQQLGDLSSSYHCSPELDRRALKSVGNCLWEELIPDELKRKYWELPSDINSLLITSDEPWIPWEMIKPYRFNKGEEEQHPFWCEKFSMSRWLSGPGTVEKLPAQLVISVAPTITDLACLEREVAFLQNLNDFCFGISSIPTINSVLELETHIRNDEFSILHFACHGMFDNISPNYSAIQLNDGLLHPSDIRLNFQDIDLRPLIFINACHSGRSGFSFTKIGGWAERFVNARVGVFIGAMWEVNDELAFQFAKTFYTSLLKDNLTVSQALKKSRQAIKQSAPYNSTWLAYSLYADPEARVQLGDISGTVANTINQLPSFDNEPHKQELKELLSQLQTVVLATDLDDEDQQETLEQINAIASALSDNQNRKLQRKAKGAMVIIQDIVAALPPSAAMVSICNQLPDLMGQVF